MVRKTMTTALLNVRPANTNRQTDRRTDKQTALLSAYLYESEYAEELSTRTQLQRELYFSNRDFQSIHPKNMNVSSD